MKSKFYSYLKNSLLSLPLLATTVANAQMTDDNVFLKGKFLEVGIAPIGAFGSNTDAPEDFHPRTSAWGGGLPQVGFVSDPAMDGWDVGTPDYVGDYFLPGDPQEGWDVQIDGVWNQAWRGAGGDGDMFRSSSGAPTLTGENIDYYSIGSKLYGVWEGSMATDLYIKQTTILDTNRVFFVCQVVLKNTGTTTLESIYYNRTVDPDNESAMEGGSSSTTYNEVVFQPGGGDNKCLVTGTGLNYPDYSYLGLGAVDCRAKSYIISSGLNPDRLGTSLDEIYDETAPDTWGQSYLWGEGENRTTDVGVGLVFNIGDLEPGDSTTISYAYILREADLDSAFSTLEKSWVVDEATVGTGDSVIKCAGGTININIEDGGTYEWGEWFPTDGLSETSGSSNVITVGTDTITYRVIGTTIICPESDTMYITVIPEIIPSPGEDGTGTLCINHEPVDAFSYLGGEPETGGIWSGAGVTPSGIFTPVDAGIGTHVLTYTRMVGECSSFSTVTMTVHNDVDMDFDYALVKGCNGDTVNFTNNSEAGTYRWNFADGSPQDTIANPSHFYEEQGEYGVWLIVKTANGCYDSLLKIVNTAHPLDAAFNMDTDSICQNSTISFLDQSIGNVQNWYWEFGDGATSTDQSPTHAYTLAGTHQVMLVVTDDVPCNDTAYATVYIDSIPELFITADKHEICQGDRVNMSLQYLYTAQGFIWDFGDATGLNDGSSATFHSYDQPGTYYILATSQHPVCDDASARDTIVVKPYPVVNLGPDTTLCLNGTPLMISTNNLDELPAGTTWSWSSGDTTAVIKVVHPGTYVATADLDGCKGSDEIVVTKDCYTDIPNSFTPNGDGVNDYFYPRQLLSKGVASFTMTVFDRWGQKIFETSAADGRGWDGRFNDKDQPVGVYIYQMNVIFKNGASENFTGNVTLIR